MSLLKNVKHFNSVIIVKQGLKTISNLFKYLIPIFLLLLLFMWCHITYKYIEHKYRTANVGDKWEFDGFFD